MRHLPALAPRASLLPILALLSCASHGSSLAGANAGVSAWLTWDAQDPTVTDLATPGASNNLYVYVSNPGGVWFKGGEIDLTWNPAGDPDAGCYAHLGSIFKTSGGTTCTYLNRGTAVPVVTADDPGHLHVAWANNSTLSGCTAGAIVQLQFAFDGCADPTGCFNLRAATLLDYNNVVDQALLAGPVATVLGGSAFCAQFNHAPVLDDIAPQTVALGTTLAFGVHATDADGDPLTYGALDLPLGASLTTAGWFVWTPTASGDLGEHVVHFTAQDPSSLADTTAATIVVSTTPPESNHPPVVQAIPPQTVETGDAVSVHILASDPDGDLLAYRVEPMPAGATLNGEQFTWIPAAGQEGTYALLAIVTDLLGAADSTALDITVLERPNHAPLLAAIGPQSVDAESLLTIVMNATDSDGDPLQYSAEPLPAGATLTGTTFQWRPASDQVGVYAITFAVRDPAGAEDSEVVSIDVHLHANLPPVLDPIGPRTAVAAHLLQFTVSGVDPEGASVTFGAAPLPGGAIFSGATFAWTPDATQGGIYAILFTATDPAGGADSEWVTVTVLVPRAYHVDAQSACALCDGLSWDTAVHTIAEGVALTHAGIRDSVLVAEGTYAESRLTLPDATVLAGGYRHGLGDQRDLRAHPTILRAGANGQSVLDLAHDDVVVDGMRLGPSNCGAQPAMTVSGARDTLRQVAVTGNLTNAQGLLQILGTGAVFDRCLIVRNKIANPVAGGMVWVRTNASATLLDCDVVNDTLDGGGETGMVVDGGTATVRNVVLWGLLPVSAPVIALGNEQESVLDMQYSDVQKGWPGTGNLSVAPRFCNLLAGNFLLQASSPLLGAGENGTTIGTFDELCGAAAQTTAIGGEPVAADAPLSASASVTRGEVALRFAFGAARTASLRIFDARGALVRRLADGLQSAGPHERTWDLRDEQMRRVPAGIYLVRLDAGDARQTRRICVLR